MMPVPGLMGQTTVHIVQAPVACTSAKGPTESYSAASSETHRMSELRGFQADQLSCRILWFQRRRTTPGRRITHGLLTTQTCGTFRQQRIQTGWRLARTFWIKIVSSRGHSLQAGTISSSATTRSGRFRQLFDDWGSIPDRSTEFSDLTPSERSKVTKSRTSCR